MDSGLVALFGRRKRLDPRVRQWWACPETGGGWIAWLPGQTFCEDTVYPSWREALAAVRAAEEGR